MKKDTVSLQIESKTERLTFSFRWQNSRGTRCGSKVTAVTVFLEEKEYKKLLKESFESFLYRVRKEEHPMEVPIELEPRKGLYPLHILSRNCGGGSVNRTKKILKFADFSRWHYNKDFRMDQKIVYVV